VSAAAPLSVRAELIEALVAATTAAIIAELEAERRNPQGDVTDGADNSSLDATLCGGSAGRPRPQPRRGARRAVLRGDPGGSFP
jgi:hypothetical protein